MRLAMIEGDELHAELLRRYVKAWGVQRRIPLVLTSFSGMENFWSMWEEQYGVDALLVDVRMEEAERGKLVRTARKHCPELAIIFTAGIAESGEEQAERPRNAAGRDRLFRCMDRVLRRDENRERLTVRTRRDTLELAAEKIMYIEAMERGSIVEFCPQRGRTFQIECMDSLAALEERLNGEHFVRCHRSYIVRLDNIRRVGRSGIELKNGSRVPVSRRIYGELNRMLQQRRGRER